jgi:ATP synthase protein I
MNPKDEEPPNEFRKIGAMITIPFVLSVPPIMGWYLGKGLDWLFGTDFLMYVMLLLGFVGGFRETFRIIKRFGNE